MSIAEMMRDESRAPYRDALAARAIGSLEGRVESPFDALTALALAVAAMLKTAPFDIRGELTAATVAQIQNGVRESLQ
jgi:hypothetical protein